MGFPAVYYCVILPQPLFSLLQLLDAVRHCLALALSSAGLAPPPASPPAAADPDALHYHLHLADGPPSPPPIKERLPVVKFAGAAAAEGATCAVCLGALERGEDVRELGGCSHAFHRPCIDQWMDMGQVTCPLCRSLIISLDHY